MTLTNSLNAAARRELLREALIGFITFLVSSAVWAICQHMMKRPKPLPERVWPGSSRRTTTTAVKHVNQSKHEPKHQEAQECLLETAITSFLWAFCIYLLAITCLAVRACCTPAEESHCQSRVSVANQLTVASLAKLVQAYSEWAEHSELNRWTRTTLKIIAAISIGCLEVVINSVGLKLTLWIK